jgi:quinol monooxygenase YgiN
MPHIAADQPVVTLINVFTVDPARQQQLVDVLVEATRQTMRTLPGFVSASIHVSLDHTRVTNYAQWRSADDFQAMLNNPAAQTHMQRCAQLATFEPHLYTVAFVDEAE